MQLGRGIRLIAILLGCCASIAAQAQNPAPAGAAQSAVRPATLVLPHKVYAGQAATLAVLDANGALLPGAVVEFSGGETLTTDSTGRAKFTVPTLPEGVRSGVLSVRVPASNLRGTTIVGLPADDAPKEIRLGEVPVVAALHDRFTITGTGFPGDADAVRVTIGSEPALVLAASPVTLVLMTAPRTPPGPAQIAVASGDAKSAPQPITIVVLEITFDRPRFAPKEKGMLTVRVRGSEQPQEIELRNLAPQILRMEKADVLRIRTGGGSDNFAAVEVEGRAAGEFLVSARLIPMAAGLPDTEAALQHLRLARRGAPEGWGPRLDPIIRRIEDNPQDVPRIRIELEKLLAASPPAETGRLIEAAWRALLAR